ncbi:MAG: PA2779 family protein [Rhodovibrionaceae bacterium]|nr:PA2779 family protein [Rhodovibrionaceae bacterium]
MNAFLRFCRALTVPVAVLFLASTLAPTAAIAGMVGTDTVIEGESASTDRQLVMDFMAREDVRGQLEDWGVAPDEAESRVAALSDSEIAAIAEKIREEPAGEGVVGPIVGALLIVFIILLITDIAGVTDVFPFVKK